MKAFPFWPFASLILLPVIILAAVGAWGLRAQRSGALADAQAQARVAVQQALGDLEKEFQAAVKQQRPTHGIAVPVPPSKVSNEVDTLHLAVKSKNLAELTRLAQLPPEELSAAGLPIATLAALAGLECGDFTNPHFNGTAARDDLPSILTEKWLWSLPEAKLATPLRQAWEHDERVRIAFWDAAQEDWRIRQTGLHIVRGELFWLCRADFTNKKQISALCEVELANLLQASLKRSGPAWMGFSVQLGGKLLLPFSPPQTSGEVLATASGIFTLEATLLRPELLYAAVDRQGRWMAWVLASAVFAAGAGLWLIHRTLAKERRLGELKSQFVSSVSHELRAPIGSLRLMAEGLASGKVTGEPAKEFHRLMASEGARLSNFIEDVLDFARIEQGRKVYVFAETDIVALVGDAVKLMQPQAQARGLRLETKLPTLPQAPSVNAPALQQAVINLLDNAIKFSPEQTIIQISLSEDAVAKTWTLSVQDQGPGVPKHEQRRIFEKFYRLGNELRRESTGTGIGLALVKHITEAHGGKVVLQSGVGEGSLFQLVFPSTHTPL
jgi:signal transduction histidine kinase